MLWHFVEQMAPYQDGMRCPLYLITSSVSEDFCLGQVFKGPVGPLCHLIIASRPSGNRKVIPVIRRWSSEPARAFKAETVVRQPPAGGAPPLRSLAHRGGYAAQLNRHAPRQSAVPAPDPRRCRSFWSYRKEQTGLFRWPAPARYL